ncbi:MAG: NUDIX domain-containing protein [Chloroflexi bacterium]|nr:NUDIX domain-containing protein [Chloroflexota bacterium]
MPLPSGRVSEHLRWLRSAVPDERLFAPRVAVLLAGADDEEVVVDGRGELPWADVELETSLAATARGLLATLGIPFAAVAMEPVAALAGTPWWETSTELGPLAPVWIVVRAGRAGGPAAAALRTLPAGDVRLVREAVARERGEVDGDPGDRMAAIPGGDYIARIRRRIGHARIFYPWAGLGIRNAEGRLLLVRHALLQQWHCPGGGMELHEAPEMTAARELREETSLAVRPGRLIGCFSRHVRAFPNGDRIQGVTLFMEGSLDSGELRPDPTGEIDAMGWYASDELPPLHPPWDGRVRLLLTGEGPRVD